LGYKPEEWEQVKGAMAAELKEWAKVAKSHRLNICFEPHAGHAAETPERALWLVGEVGSPHIRVMYDYSHFSLAGLPLRGTMQQLLPASGLLHLKDGVNNAGKFEYLIPGDGKVDYNEYFQLARQFGYRGHSVVLVSGRISGKPGYQPVETARVCYTRMSAAMAKAGISRPNGKV
ncbi:MAG: sugar phosphate isomerase/epimerase, partial [Bryobacteraceae bacterium]